MQHSRPFAPSVVLRNCRDALELRDAVRLAGEFLTDYANHPTNRQVYFTVDDERYGAWWTPAGTVVVRRGGR